MNNPPKNKTNQNKNLFFFIKDLSNNNPFLDPSNSIIKNPLFSPLQPWKRNKNLLLLNDKDNSDNDFKKREDSFTMRMDNIIDKIREERQENSKNIKSPNIRIFCKFSGGITLAQKMGETHTHTNSYMQYMNIYTG